MIDLAVIHVAMLHFQDPGYLLFLAALPLWFLLRRTLLAPPAMAFSSLELVHDVSGRGRARYGWIIPSLTAVALVLLVLALVRPQWEERNAVQRREGVDILLLLDVSSSMGDRLHAEGRTNLDAAKAVLTGFTRTREDDRLGLITFARYPKLACPLTTDREALAGLLEAAAPVPRGSELDGTAIGAALAEGARRLDPNSMEELEERDRVVILVTDGEENQYAVDPLDGAELLRSLGIKAHTVAVAKGESGERASAESGNAGQPAARGASAEPGPPGMLSTRLHEAIARRTGGKFARAASHADLEAVCKGIDALEKRPVEVINFTRNHDLFRFALLPAWLLLIVRFFLARSILARTP